MAKRVNGRWSGKGKYWNTVFARHEPTTDSATRNLYEAGNRGLSPDKIQELVNQHLDVVIYGDKKCKRHMGTFPWYSKKPDHRNRVVTLNCVIWDLQWLPPKKG